MDRVQANEEDFLSIQYARRLQEQYDNEAPLKRKAPPTQDRGLIDDQRSAYEESCAIDKSRQKEARQKEQARQAEQAAEEALAAKEVVKPLTSAEMRERRIKAFSTPTAN